MLRNGLQGFDDILFEKRIEVKFLDRIIDILIISSLTDFIQLMI